MRPPRTRRAGRDRGASFLEVMIALALMGTVVGGTLAALRATVIAGTAHRDHSNAHAWLQSASDLLYAESKVLCDPLLPDGGEATVRAAYEAIVDSVPNPEGWQDWQIRVVPPVEFWNAANIDSDPDIEHFFATTCDPMRELQRVKIEVRSSDGDIIEDVEIVK